MTASPLLRTFGIGARHHISRAHRIYNHRRFIHGDTTPHNDSSSSSNTHHKQARVLPSVAIALAILGTASYFLAPSSRSSTLNESTFVPYTITACDAISPSSVLFTITPPHQHGASSLPYLAPQASTQWKHPLWSVEFKQPEVQIARYYTPLPPHHDEDPRDGKLRFYVRAVNGGEMSNYLRRLRVGNEVYLRGPHPGFDVLGRLGACKNVVFLAGGTGVVPGMQVARAVLENDDSAQMKLLWAVRKREEAQSVSSAGQQQQRQPWWKVWTTGIQSAAVLTEMTTDLENPSAIAEELMRLKDRFGSRLQIRLAVDEENTQFTAKEIQSALRTCQEIRTPVAMAVGKGCLFHDQLLHVQASEFEDPGSACRCEVDLGGRPGKNLFMVSGPDGFVTHYAGQKRWLGGTLTQGSVGGVVGQLQTRDVSLASDWLVLKL
ncbi:hypothetical protein E4U60_002677 [Claviceps pazoutovae]|uniref:FAD-binding FR-type domain-containing protein n=1 Tax=Claviceps pazoutovae TaxID=1649127 RepID=A0A9P7MBB3_9HYPO|nr:hypothetical protein E4U60_002677 [Claviceps pazoutovae]